MKTPLEYRLGLLRGFILAGNPPAAIMEALESLERQITEAAPGGPSMGDASTRKDEGSADTTLQQTSPAKQPAMGDAAIRKEAGGFAPMPCVTSPAIPAAEAAAAPGLEAFKTGWNSEKIAQLRQLAEEGLSDQQIGERLGASRTTIIKQRQRHGIKTNSRRGRNAWPPERIEKLRKMVSEGLSDQQIAARFGLNAQTIWYHRRRFGIKATRKRGPYATHIPAPATAAPNVTACPGGHIITQADARLIDAQFPGIKIKQCPPGYAFGAEPGPSAAPNQQKLNIHTEDA